MIINVTNIGCLQTNFDWLGEMEMFCIYIHSIMFKFSTIRSQQAKLVGSSNSLKGPLNAQVGAVILLTGMEINAA